MKIITYGTFDMLHLGHINLLKKSKSLGDKLYVGVSTDEFCENEKNKKTVQLFSERYEILQAIRYVDVVFAENSWSQKTADIKKYSIELFVIGDDWQGKFDYLKKYCQVLYLPRTKGISTSSRKIQIVKKFS